MFHTVSMPYTASGVEFTACNPPNITITPCSSSVGIRRVVAKATLKGVPGMDVTMLHSFTAAIALPKRATKKMIVDITLCFNYT